MKSIKLTINGKKYWYAYDAIYVTKGITKKTTKCLGRVEKSTEQSREFRKNKFIQKLIHEEAKARTAYWEKQINNAKPFEEVGVDKLELLRSQLYRYKENLGNLGQSAMEIAFMIDFIYNSNKMEGSRLARGEVKKLVEQKLDSDKEFKNEVANTMKALALADKRKEFTLAALKKIHKELFIDQPSIYGFRNEEVVVGNDATVSKPEDIQTKLIELFNWVDENLYSVYPLELAFLFYYKFERIHPFVDGNGRVGRILMNELLKKLRYHPIIVWDSQRNSHFSSFKKAVAGNLKPFLRFMINQYKITYDEYQNKIQNALQLQNKVDFFLTPSRV